MISFLLDRYRDGTIGLLTGFISGSLLIIWPWKDPVYLLDGQGSAIVRKGRMIIEGYVWHLPDISDTATWISVIFIALGMGLVIFIESIAQRYNGS